MKTLAYYKLLSICNTDRPAEYSVHLTDAPDENVFSLILYDGTLCSVHDQCGTTEIQGNIYECLEWCLEWYKETFVDNLINYFDFTDGIGYRRCGAYDVYIHKIKGLWDLTINVADSDDVLIIRHKFKYAGQALDAAARWIWNTKYYEFNITPELIATFVEIITNKVIATWSDGTEYKILQNTAGDNYYAARWYAPDPSNLNEGWLYERYPKQQLICGPRIYNTPAKIALRIARDIVYNEYEHEFGFSSFWEWLKDGIIQAVGIG